MDKILSHTDEHGKARMVDVGDKPSQVRIATAKGSIAINAETLQLIRENAMKKGDVIAVAEVAAIQAAKKTSGLIPLCHPLLLDQVKVTTTITDEGVEMAATVRCTGRTGVEMEALTAVSVGLLTLYDMCKAVDKNMTINSIKLTEKTKRDE